MSEVRKNTKNNNRQRRNVHRNAWIYNGSKFKCSNKILSCYSGFTKNVKFTQIMAIFSSTNTRFRAISNTSPKGVIGVCEGGPTSQSHIRLTLTSTPHCFQNYIFIFVVHIQT